MKPVFVCQLPEKEQAEIKRLLEGLILHGCGGDKAEVQRYYGMSFEEAVQNGMDSKIVDLDYLMVFYSEDYQTEKADEKFQLADAAVISSILKEARKHETDNPFVYVQSQSAYAPGAGQEDGDWER